MVENFKFCLNTTYEFIQRTNMSHNFWTKVGNSSRITCSWHQKAKPRIHEFTVKRPESLLNPIYNGVLFFIHYLKSLAFSFSRLSKTFCSTLIRELANLCFFMSRTGCSETDVKAKIEFQLNSSTDSLWAWQTLRNTSQQLKWSYKVTVLGPQQSL